MSADSPSHRVFHALLFAAVTLLAACGGGGGDTAVSGNPPSGGSTPTAPEEKGVFTGFGGNPAWVVTGLEGDGGGGGVGGGADGGGGVGAGGSLGQFRDALVYATLDDGTRLGPAATDPATGMVTIKPGRSYAGSLVVELIGQGGTTYFDESKNAWLAYPAGQKLRVHVDAIRSNIGITPLTEAAVAYAETDARLSQLPLRQRATESNDRILQVVNNQLPASYAFEQASDLTALPVLLNSSSAKGALPNTAAGRHGTVIAALAFAASRHNPSLAAPALAAATQFAKDLADGNLNGAGPDGGPLAPSDQLAYLATDLSAQLVAAISTVNQRYGVDGGDPALPQTVAFGRYYGGKFTARLLSDGRVLARSGDGEEAPLPVNDAIAATSLPATALFGDGEAMMVRRVDGSVHAVGINPFPNGPGAFRFAVRAPDDSAVPVAVAESLSQERGATEIVFGPRHAVARTAAGQALAWGDNSSLQLGVAGVAASVSPLVAVQGDVRGVAASLSFALAQLVDGRVLSWGSDRTGALGRGPNALFQQTAGTVLTASGAPLTGVVAIVAAGANGLAVRTDGLVWGWGSASQGLLADAAEPIRYQAAPVNGLQGIRKLVPVEGGMIALDEAGVVFYWGLAANRETRVPPGPIAGLPRIRDIQDRGDDAGVALGFRDEVFTIGAFGAVSR